MSDLREAFIGYTDNNAELKFDIFNIGDNQHLGIVSLPNSTGSDATTESFTYKVYPMEKQGNNDALPFGFGSSTPKVIEGVITKTNNTTFNFPITNLSTNYFVLVTNNTPIDSGVRGSNGLRDAMLREVSTSLKTGETFGVFYPKKVMKARRTKLTEAIKQGPNKSEREPCDPRDQQSQQSQDMFSTLRSFGFVNHDVKQDDSVRLSPFFHQDPVFTFCAVNETKDWLPTTSIYTDKEN
jgi:hypothetical protein